MDSGWPSKRAILPRLAGALDDRRLGAYALALAFVCAIGMILVGIRAGPSGKIDANRLISPWDRSAAPPAFRSRASIKVIAKPQLPRAPKPLHRRPARRT